MHHKSRTGIDSDRTNDNYDAHNNGYDDGKSSSVNLYWSDNSCTNRQTTARWHYYVL
jgi:hypothetical protein